ncbi:hypothetical protein D7234_14455 [Legionella pneumophila]|nr:hypothetical protein D7234_14455 [Legionella pneumophila]
MLASTYSKGVISIIFFLLLSNSSYSDSDQYLCITKQTVGFEYNNKINDWVITSFKGEKYIISKCSNSDKETFWTMDCEYKLTKMGDTQSRCGCKYYSKASILCDCFLADFKFSLVTGRFLEVGSNGYWNPNYDSDTPYMRIGNCSPF